MKIVHIIYMLNTGGIQTMLVDIVNEQSKTEDVSVIIVNNIIEESIIKSISNSVKVYKINRKPGSRFPFKVIKLNLLLLKLNPDIIHCHNSTLINLLRFVFCRRIYLTVHDIGYSDSNFSKYKSLFAISESVQNDVLSKGNYKTKLVYNGIDTSLIKTKNDYKKKEYFKLIQISRLEHNKKGQHILIQALEGLKHNDPNCFFILDIIGDGESYEYLKNMVETKGLSNNITFLGDKPRSFIYENLKNYDLLVQPSLFEGFGLTITEAMSAIVPVLVSDIDGPMEIIKNGKYGEFFKSSDSIDCSKKIQYIMNNYDVSIEKAINAKEYCDTNFSIKQTAKRYIDFYNEN